MNLHTPDYNLLKIISPNDIFAQINFETAVFTHMHNYSIHSLLYRVPRTCLSRANMKKWKQLAEKCREEVEAELRIDSSERRHSLIQVRARHGWGQTIRTVCF